ncbi:nicotinate-nucleotide adenylyltransferase [Thalassoroseus pseudoceratinae]|uniref:nicotinate-nucleotide adenylyltransferase n=1 Tax=Thalassoroseus pseudoceratinae TaxID=2713176 RepID=UPI0014249EBF|nr:nicotinate-nucleotide adenylyltransferase [Thalassoroseus pseudoceratinae]
MRIGIYGGTFDPIHFGHLVLAEQCRDSLDLDEIWFVLAGDPPHKTDLLITESTHREAMLRLAIAGNETFRLDRRELTRSGRSYSVDTLQEITDENPRDEIFFLIGSDSLRDFPTWRHPQRIAELATIVAVNRGDDIISDVENIVGEQIAKAVQTVQIPGIEISSSNIRRRVQLQKSVRYLLPPSVEIYISEHNLYTAKPDQS